MLIPLGSYGNLYLLSNSVVKLKSCSFVELAYGYLPIALGANLAHYLRLGLTEAGQILPVTMATFGWEITGLPVLVAHPAVIAFLQGVTLLLGLILGILLTQKIAKQPFTFLIPQYFSYLLLTVIFWHLIVL
jgi:hypothetical protein